MGSQYSDWSYYRTRTPDLVAVDKKERSCKITDFAVPGDSRIEKKKKDKIEKYQDLQSISIELYGNKLNQVGITARKAEVQEKVLLRTGRTLRKILEV